ncbi:MAG: diguanylate cyclase [Salinisphaera sp.]|jgi:diguanylate cyclase (GGDEF)-like protein/PAS domain S-box-containing protein|nr:diguanylate cyclase [Salinisphaera sp.]
MNDIAIDVLEKHGLGGTWWYDLDTREIWWSQGIYRIHNVDSERYVPTPETVVNFYEPESRLRVRSALEKAASDGTGWSLTLLLRRRSGELRYVYSMAEVEQRLGKAPLLVGAFFDVHEATVERIEEQAQAQRLQEQHSRRWRIASENAGLAIIDFDSEHYCLSGELARQIGLSDGDEILLSTDDWERLVHTDDREVRQQRLRAHRAGETEFYVSEYRLCLPDSREVWVREAGRQTVDGDTDSCGHMIGALSDITDRKQAEQVVFQAKELAEVTFEAIGEGFIRVNGEGRITEINSAACALLGCPASDAIDQPFAQVVQLYDPAQDRRLPDPVEAVLAHSRRIRVPIFTRLRRHDGAQLSIVDSVSPIHASNGQLQGVVFVFQDISEARRMTDELVHQASHDPLTGLPNRREFQQALDAAWRRVRAGLAQIYLIYIDLDHFKDINDCCGHAAGDALLRKAATTLRAILRDSDILARIGGDEFAAIVYSRSSEGVETIAEKLIAAASGLRLHCAGRDVAVGVTLGVAELDPALASNQEALARADAALYTAKGKGRGQFHVYKDVSDHVSDQVSR